MDPRDASASKKHLGIGDKKVLENTEWRVFGGAALCTVPPRRLSLNLYKYKRIYKCAFSCVPPVLGFSFSALSSMFNMWLELTNAGSMLIFAKNLTGYSGRNLELPQFRNL